MKLRYEFTMMDMGGEIAAVPVGEGAKHFHGMLKLNDMAAEILSQLSEETTPEKVHAYLKEQHPEATNKEIAETLTEFLNQLIREGLLIAP